MINNLCLYRASENYIEVVEKNSYYHNMKEYLVSS